MYVTFTSGLPRFKTVQGCRKSHVCQLVIRSEIIITDEISLRHGPCICRLAIISYSKNENCAHFVNLSPEKKPDKFAKLRAWRVHKLTKE